ncbi:MAG TPA: hypothetical protein VIS52_05475 [Motiliproteus sp.]
MTVERRSNPRALVNWKAQVKRRCGAQYLASVANVCVDGLELILDRSLPQGEIFELDLVVRQPGVSSYIRLSGAVCHCHCLAANLGCTIGVQLQQPPLLYRHQVERLQELGSPVSVYALV